MIGRQDRWQEELFVACRLRDLIPEEHILKRVDMVLETSWLRQEVREHYCEQSGRPSIDPEAALRLMLAGFFQGIVHDRKLMREAQVNIAMRWFAGYKLHEKLPHHSSLTRIRQRWGDELFKKIFQRTVRQCVDAGLVNAETVHVDATLIRADVSWESLTTRHVEDVIKENECSDVDGPCGGERRKRSGDRKKFSRTDPDATLSTTKRGFHMEPSYKQHTVVEDKAGVVVEVEVTTGEASEGKKLLEQISRAKENTGKEVKVVSADAAYASASNYSELESGGIEAVIPPQREAIRAGRIRIGRFKHDARNGIVKCPRGRKLRRSCRSLQGGWIYRASKRDCACCSLAKRCVPRTAKVRTILITDGYEALLRARRRRARWGQRYGEIYNRHRWRAESAHAEAKVIHGLRRAVRRGLANVAIQSYLTAAVMNLKRLAAFLFGSIGALLEPEFAVT